MFTSEIMFFPTFLTSAIMQEMTTRDLEFIELHTQFRPIIHRWKRNMSLNHSNKFVLKSVSPSAKSLFSVKHSPCRNKLLMPNTEYVCDYSIQFSMQYACLYHHRIHLVLSNVEFYVPRLSFSPMIKSYWHFLRGGWVSL